MQKATIDITCELLADLLHLPDTAKVLYSVQPRLPNTIRLVVDSPDFPEVKEGALLPEVLPRFRTEQSPSTVTFVDWMF